MRRSFSPWVDCVVWLFTGWLAGLAITLLVWVVMQSAAAGDRLGGVLQILPNVVGIGVVIGLGLPTARARPRVVLALRKPPWKTFPWIALSSTALALLGAGLNTWLDRIWPMPSWVSDLFQQVLEYRTLPQLLGVLLFLVVVAPVTEELMFRGLFLYRLEVGYGPRTAILGSALCFGIFHLIPWQAVPAALIGIYLGWLLVVTRSIAAPMAAHALFNLVPVVATGLAGTVPALRGLGAGGESEAFRLPPTLLLATIAALVAGIAGTLRSAGRSTPPREDPFAVGPPDRTSPGSS